MSSDCIVKLTHRQVQVVLYLESKGTLAQAGAKVAQCARVVQEGETRQLIYMSDFLTVGSGLDFCPVPNDIDINDSELGHFYHVDVTERGNVIIGYRNGSTLKRYKLSTFIKKVNKARRSANYPYKMLRQPSPQPEPEPTSYTRQERLEIANTILTQMGGNGRLTAMIGMHNPMTLDSPAGLKFNFRGSRKANICQVIYNPGSDTYDFELYYYTPVRYEDCPKVYEAQGVYCDMLKELFSNFTGLDLHL